MRRLATAVVIAAAAISLAACGSSSSSTASGSTPPASPTSGAAADCTPVAKVPAVTNLSNPKIARPCGPQPTVLITKNLKVGKGKLVKPGATITADYTGVTWSTGTTFDSTYDASFGHKQPAQFPLSNVIVGWQKGIPGMRVGGIRELVIPADQAYGASGSAPSVGPNEGLVFVVHLVSVP